MVSEISTFYKNQTIFLTGCSGFLGKVILVKLLKACPDIKTIYLLIRSKKNKTAAERLTDLLNSQCFEGIRQTNEKIFEKLILVNGDCNKSNLDISQDDLSLLYEEVTCVIHAAANVRFDQSLKQASLIIKTTKDLLEISKNMRKLQCFVFVSTAYSNLLNRHIKEEFYEPPMKFDSFLSIVDGVSDDELEKITPHILGAWPNTYVYTKCIAEDMIRSYSELPIVIVRPAIITSGWKEPIPGWIDSIFGPMGITVVACLGILRSFLLKDNAIAANVPVDFVSNCIIALIWKETTNPTKQKINIYNFTNDPENCTTWAIINQGLAKNCWKYPSPKIYWYYTGPFTDNVTLHKIRTFFLHTVLSYVMDFVLFCMGRPRMAVKGYKRLDHQMERISYFTTRSWYFDRENVLNLWRKMSDEDKKLFNFDMGSIVWPEYLKLTVLGLREFLFKETLDMVPEGQRVIWKYRILHYSVVGLFWYLVYRIVMFIFGCIF